MVRWLKLIGVAFLALILLLALTHHADAAKTLGTAGVGGVLSGFKMAGDIIAGIVNGNL